MNKINHFSQHSQDSQSLFKMNQKSKLNPVLSIFFKKKELGLLGLSRLTVKNKKIPKKNTRNQLALNS